MKIPVTKETPASSFAATILVGVLGLTLGIGLGVISEGSRANLAAVGAISPAQTIASTNASISSGEPIETPEEVSEIIATESPTLSALVQDTKDGEVLGATIDESTNEVQSAEALALAREALDLRIRVLKDRGIALVAEFTQNCGSWEEPCAVPYRTELETINTAYRDAEAERATLGQ